MDPYMTEALFEARRALEEDEVPVGAVIVKDGKIIARGHDRRMQNCDPTAHAEIEAIRAAAQSLGDWRLDGCHDVCDARAVRHVRRRDRAKPHRHGDASARSTMRSAAREAAQIFPRTPTSAATQNARAA